MIGLYYSNQRSARRTTQNFTLILSPTSGLNFRNIRDYVRHTKSYAAFGQISYTPGFAPGLELTGRIRDTYDEKTLRQANSSNATAQTPIMAKTTGAILAGRRRPITGFRPRS